VESRGQVVGPDRVIYACGDSDVAVLVLQAMYCTILLVIHLLVWSVWHIVHTFINALQCFS
jgi:hypothetical protein